MSCCMNASGHLRLSPDMRINENSISSWRRYLLCYKTAKRKQKPLKSVENLSRFFPRQLILHLSLCLLVEAELNICAVPGETWAKGWPKLQPSSPFFMEHLPLGLIASWLADPEPYQSAYIWPAWAQEIELVFILCVLNSWSKWRKADSCVFPADMDSVADSIIFPQWSLLTLNLSSWHS